MKELSLTGKVNSIQTLGTLDGPGVRFVVFMQGCNLRCGCCHNPDTWEMGGGTVYTPKELADKCERYREYFKDTGGITVSGGEPILQADFVKELFVLCHQKGINTCLDTSGSILNDSVKELLRNTDRVLLDIKYTNDSDYLKFVGCSIDTPLRFLEFLDVNAVPTTIRQVIIPTLNDSKENILRLKEIMQKYSCVDSAELLPFKKMCSVKYEKLGIKFKFGDLPEAKKLQIDELYEILNK